ncbi:MAG: hypothetical protein LCH32_01615 [Bacteroidetes bacterium]|nr:hypothetical protein [Bacteroidota bacterium]MCA0429179.1 hypothetical protein [Bacteroidota bacterium]
MGLFDIFKSDKKETNLSKSGFYTITNKNLTPLNEEPAISGSIKEIASSLGHQNYHGIRAPKSDKIAFIAFKRRTQEPIFVEAKNTTEPLLYSDIIKIIQEIDWAFEWRQIDFEDNNS